MKEVRYRRPRANYRRILRSTDFENMGILGVKESLVWSSDNNFTIVLNNKLSDSLVAKLPDEFIALDVDEDDELIEVKDVMTSLASSSGGDPQSSTESKDGSADDDDESLTDKVDPEA